MPNAAEFRTYPLLAITHCLFKKAVRRTKSIYFFSAVCGGGAGLAYLLSSAQDLMIYTELSKINCFTKFWWYIPTGAIIGLFLGWLHEQFETRSQLK